MRTAVFCLRLLAGASAIGGVLWAGQAGPELSSPLHPYSLKLESFVPSPGRAMGVLLKVRINDGRPLRLLLDSGAEHIVLTRTTARAHDLLGGTRLSLIGFGAMEQAAGAVAIADTVEIGPLAFRNCRVDVVDHKVVEGADGVLPLALFSDFLVRLDFPGKVLSLTPYREQSRDDFRGRFTRALAVNAVLFLKLAVDELHNGYFLLDTGAAHNALSGRIARALGGPGIGAPTKVVHGANGVSRVQAMKALIHFRTAEQDITSDDVVLVDLDNMSRYNGLEVSGLLGFPALSRYVVTVNYRDSLVRMEAAQ